MEHLVEEAFRVAIVTEINSYRAFNRAAAMMPDGSAKQVLERLVRVQRKIIEGICGRCPYPASQLAEQMEVQHQHCLHPYPQESRERKLYRHLHAAMMDRHCAIEKYMIFAASFREPEVCQVFQLALDMSRQLFDVIAQSCRQLDLKLPAPMANRRKKRVHFKPLTRPAPNKHSELFLSLVDAGRRSLF
ncbi:MAG TPA: hypothetical protein VJ550_06945 [Geomonas sp.]|nr:hypothetical protein [Geomonas sp.]